MYTLVTGKQMKLLDHNTTILHKVPTVVLMEQAAMVFVRELFACDIKLHNVLVVCGKGNNAADGVAIARLLNQLHIPTAVYFADPDCKDTDSLLYLQKEIYESYGYRILDNLESLEEFSCLIDAVFGIGLSRNLEGNYATLAERMNQFKGCKVACDIASGVNADTGEIMGCAFCADYTITFSFGKVGQYLWPGNTYSGIVRIADMGITDESWGQDKPSLYALDDSDWKLFPKRQAHSNKGTYGKLLIVAGNEQMAGAAVLSAKAAYRTGCGLVKVFTSEKNRITLNTSVPEAIVCSFQDKLDTEEYKKQIQWADAIVFGPGIGTGETAKIMLDILLQTASVPVVIDADGCNLLALSDKTLADTSFDTIITPHPGEMSRLCGRSVSDIQTHLLEVAESYAASNHTVCVLKDFHTITAIPNGKNYMNLSGNHGMAVAGSGDVLSGIIGSLLAQGADTEAAASFGVYLHGCAGDAARKQVGCHSLTASDIIDGISCISKKVDQNER